jgi:long-chain acyl-CoA synthetase
VAAATDGQTVPSAFLATVASRPDATALRWEGDDGTWAHWTFAEYRDRVAAAVAGLEHLGVGRGDRVVMMMRNIPYFHVWDVAATFLGATPVSIYNSSSPEQVEYLVGHCSGSVAILEDQRFYDRFAPVRSQLGSLRHVVTFSPLAEGAPDAVTAADLVADLAPADLDGRRDVSQPDDLATVIYTSGTTGPPKGVMITHRNVAWTIESLRRRFDLGDLAGKRLVSYLPMAHIAERTTSHYQQLTVGFEVTSCPEPSEIGRYLREVRPNILFGVPRIWEKLYAGAQAMLAGNPEQATAFADAVERSKPLIDAIDWERATDAQREEWAALDESAGFRLARELLGLDQVDTALSGAAPLPVEILLWFRAIGVPLGEIYGMSENTGPMTWTPNHIKPGTVGPAIPDCDVRLADDGEVLCRGGNVFTGYLNDPAKTADALIDGWLQTGDIGELDADGYLRIIDRKKELIITAGGKNVSPANLEAELKTIPLVGQAMAVGDQRPFVAALVVLDPEVAPAWARAQGIEFDSLEDLANDPRVIAEIEQGLGPAMESFNNAERVKKVKVLGEEWLPDSDLLTPTSKLKRRGVMARYGDEVEALYSS